MIVCEAVAVQLLASVTVTVYVPAARPVRFSVVAPFDHRYVSAPVPPATVKLIAPVEPPLQLTLVEEAMLALRAVAGCVIVCEAVAVQLLASVTVTLYVPAPRPVRFSVAAPFDHRYVSAPVPPVTVRLIAPVEPPLQLTLVKEAMLTDNPEGWLTT